MRSASWQVRADSSRPHLSGPPAVRLRCHARPASTYRAGPDRLANPVELVQLVGCPRSGVGWSAAAGQRLGGFGHASFAGQGLTQQHFDLSGDAAVLIARPPSQRVVYIGVDAQQHLFAFAGHV